MEADTPVAAERLVGWAARLLEAHGASPGGAERVARALVEADRSGHRSHGVWLLPYYLELIASGGLDPAAEPVIGERRGALGRMDGRRGFGQLTGEDATELALELAAEHGAAAVSGRDAGHLGRLGAYVERIAAAGMAGILLANNQGAHQQIAPLGTTERRLTNNPIAIGVPGATLDMALSVAAEGRVYRARERGERLPPGWILDSAGAPSTDPQAYIEGGSLLRLGGEAAGHKGQGLIVMVDLLVGLLASGGICGPEERPFSNSFVLLCLDPGADARAAYLDELPAFVDWVKSAAALADAPAPVIPGEPEQRAREAGSEVLLDGATLRALDEVGRAAGLPPLAG